MIKIFFILTLVMIMPINLIQAQSATQNTSNVNSFTKNVASSSSILGNLDALVTIVSTLIGISGGLFGYITHRRNETLKRQEIIFPLIDEFEKKKAIYYAKELIDGVPIKLDPNDKELIEIPIKLEDSMNLKSYTTDQLTYLLNRDDNNSEKPLNDDEILVRSILDSLLNFFGKLGYLIDNKLITKKEVSYFLYYIELAKNNTSVRKFATRLNYELFAVLLDKIGMIINDESDLDFQRLIKNYNNRLK